MLSVGSIKDAIRWYNESGSVWSIDRFDEKWYAINDSSGKEHVASIYLSDEDGIYVPAIETSADGTNTSRKLMLEFALEEGHELKSVTYMNTNTAPVQVEPKNLTREDGFLCILFRARHSDRSILGLDKARYHSKQ